MSSPSVTYESMEAFVAGLEAAGVRAVGVRAVSEVRPSPTPTGEGIVVGHQRWVDVTGYRSGVVHSLRLVDALPGPIEVELKARGFTVRTGSDNLM